YQRVLAAAWSYYRQEWSYVYHCHGKGNAGSAPTGASGFGRTLEVLAEALVRLPQPDRSLLNGLFGERRTEAEIALQFGVSQQAVSKRKRAILSRMHGVLLMSLKNSSGVRL